MARTGRPSCRSAILDALPGTIAQVARRSGKSPSSAGKWLGILHEERVVYLSKWVHRRNGPVPFYRLRVKEASKDAPKPEPLTDAEIQHRYNERYPNRRAEIRKAYEQREKDAADRRKKQVQSWKHLLTVVVSEPERAKNFPQRVEVENL